MKIVITDINMPELDGVQMVSTIFDSNPETRVVMITAHSDRQNIKKITSLGMNVELVFKPVDFENLFASIDRCIAAHSW